MDKALAAFVTGVGLVAMGVLMAFPLMAVAVITTFRDGILQFWPWAIKLIVYCLLVAILSALLNDIVLQCAWTIIAIILPVRFLWDRVGSGWTAWICLTVVAVAVFSAAMSVAALAPLQQAGLVAGVQLLWLTPLAILFYNFTRLGPADALMPLIATVMAMIATFFVADAAGLG